MMAVASADHVAMGQRISLIFDITPRRNIHVYAPGKHTYQVVKIALDPRPWLRVQPTTYPPSEIYHFKPLDERVPVYQKSFQLVQDVMILSTPAAKKVLATQKSVTISGQARISGVRRQDLLPPQERAGLMAACSETIDRRPPG